MADNELGLADAIVGGVTSVPTASTSRKRTQGIMAQQKTFADEPTPTSPEELIPSYVSQYIETIRNERGAMDYLKETVDETRLDDYEYGLDTQAQRMIDSAEAQNAYYQDGDVQQGSYYDVATRLSNDLMEDFGLSREQAAGFVGNLAHETGNFKFIQELSPKAGRGGYGFAQWTGDRREAFEGWAKSNDLDINSYEANYGYLKKELTTRDNIIGSIGVNTIDKLKEAQTVEDAAKLVSDYYLRPGKPMMNKRLSSARSVFSILK
jgi:hypothetical protein